MATTVAVAPIPAAWVEQHYSLGAYLSLQRWLTPLSNAAGFALFDGFVVLVLSLLVAFAVRRIRRRDRTGRWRMAASMAADLFVGAALLYLVFLASWGLNYRRAPIERRLDFEQARVTDEALAALARVAVSELNRLHHPAHASPWPELTHVSRSIAEPFAGAQRNLGLTRVAVPGRPKRSLLEWYFRQTAIDGMVDPFFLEILVNADVLPFERPFVVAHEWAHLAGFARESEASFVAWMVCQNGDEQTRYSGWLALYPHIVQGLSLADAGTMARRLEPRPRIDLRAIAARAGAAPPAARAAARQAYDRFLRANRVAEGVASYDAVVRLILGLPAASAPMTPPRGD
ncbi:MAG: DUF3810 family protein [Acidobacteria bacterium]|nr:DUF3810 family protein [Acidobacteriota bacterium]